MTERMPSNLGILDRRLDTELKPGATLIVHSVTEVFDGYNVFQDIHVGPRDFEHPIVRVAFFLPMNRVTAAIWNLYDPRVLRWLWDEEEHATVSVINPDNSRQKFNGSCFIAHQDAESILSLVKMVWNEWPSTDDSDRNVATMTDPRVEDAPAGEAA